MGNMAARSRRTEIVNVQTAARDDEGENRLEQYGIGHGLSEVDFMARQRYLENSRLYSACSRTVSVASQPIEPKCSSSIELHHFIQEQRKIISTFRAQPWPMQMKLAALRCYKQNLSKYVHHLNTLDTFRDSSSQVLRKLRRKLTTVCQYLTVWGTIIKLIEGHFGTSVASFFTFLRWLFALNLLLTALSMGLVAIPQSLFGHGLDVPPSMRVNGSAVSFLLDGKGHIFEYSVLFYGFYDSGQHEPYVGPDPNPHPYIGLYYKLPLAYMLVTLALFIATTAGLLFSMAEKYKLLQRASASEHYPFSWKVFASWDNAITQADTASGKKRHITISLKETIMEQRKGDQNEINIKLWIVRGLTNFLIAVCLVSTSYAIFLAVENAERTNAIQQRNFQTAISGSWLGIWHLIFSFQVQVVVSARNLFLPYVFSFAELAEKLHPRTALKLMLVRMFCLYVSSLYVLIIALFTLSKQCKSSAGDKGEDSCCWETIIGQELYKLSLTHLLADVASIVLVDGVRWFITKLRCCGKIRTWVGLAEFTLADNILRLVYGQALILLGVLFCPLLPFIGLLKNILLFYCRAFAVYFFNKPPRMLFRVASTRNFYMALLLLTVFLCALPVGYAIVQMTPSDTCGPFRGLPNMLDVMVVEIHSWPSFIQSVFEYMQTATVIVPVLALLGITIYYYAALANALKEVNKDLNLQLHVEQNEARERIAKEVRPRTMERRHEELQKAIQAELQERQMARMADQGSTSLGGYPDPHVPQEHTATGWAGQGRHTSVHVETPRFHTRY